MDYLLSCEVGKQGRVGALGKRRASPPGLLVYIIIKLVSLASARAAQTKTSRQCEATAGSLGEYSEGSCPKALL